MDRFYRKARREGYRARSVYKIAEIQNKYRMIKRGDIILDLGCAPGSWLQIIGQWVGRHGQVLGIDITPTRPLNIPNITVWKKSAMEEDIVNALLKFLVTKNAIGFSTVLSDMAPKTKGIPFQDQHLSLELAKRAAFIATSTLQARGNFIAKVFQSREAEEFLHDLRPAFAMVKMMDVTVTKKGSKEMYYVCLDFKKRT